MGKRQSAFSKALQEAQNQEQSTQPSRETVTPQDSEAVRPLNRETVTLSHGEEVTPLKREVDTRLHGVTVKTNLEKTSFYIRSDQTEKLDDLAHEYKKRKGKRINRNDIIRALIDQTDLESLVALDV
jgi:hypothetical protein